MASILFTVAAAYVGETYFGLQAGSIALAATTAAAAASGAVVDSYLLGKLVPNQKKFGPRLQNSTALSSIEGDPIWRAYGRNRITGTIIWSARFLETVTVTKVKTGGKGGGSSSTNTTTYNYSCSFAIGICEGPITKINRIFADGKVLDVTNVQYTIYYGSETQTADPTITAIEGAEFTPAYRGLAYIVFDALPLADFGNRIPQFSFEVWSPAVTDGSNFENRVLGVCVTPGAGEYVYSPEIVTSTTTFNGGNENCTNDLGESNWQVSMDQMQGVLPNLQKVNLVVSWMGTDLRCGNCEIRPEVETTTKTVNGGYDWYAGGISRSSASEVSQDSNGPLLGGTPSDLSVYQAIQDLQTGTGSTDTYRPVPDTNPQAYSDGRGLRVGFYPFILMDIPATNTLPNPYSNSASGTGQEAFPWRGRITVSPATGYTGTVDKTSTAATQIAAFVGTAVAGDFGSWNGQTIPYSGPAEWSYRRFILHYAALCIAAGGVDTFYIGSEMKFLNNIRDNTTGNFPFVNALVTLASDVKAMFVAAGQSSTKISYAADWSEWANYAPGDGTNDLFFHLDPLWSSSNIDYIGIDWYQPLSDWRDTLVDLDYGTGTGQASTIYDQTYLQYNIEHGENYSWYYASASDRVNQVRTTITDGAYSKPWVFRSKDIRSWWTNLHYNRPGGTESASHTSWAVQSKPVIFSEIGCPAVNKGANQPNVFYDPKSGESALPYFSSGARDDTMSRAYLQANLDYWNTSLTSNNPTSTVYSAPMIKLSECCIWNWDARPYPDFPYRGDVWRDAPNYQYGHWLNGRAGQCALSDLIPRLCSGLGITVDASKLYGMVIGYTLDRVMSARDAVDPLSIVYFFDPYVSGGVIKFRHRGGIPDWTISDSSLIPMQDGSPANTSNKGGDNYNLFSVARTQDVELPGQSTIKYNDELQNFNQAIVLQRRLIGASDVSADSTIGIVSNEAFMQTVCDVTLMDAWLQREQVTCIFPPQYLGMDAADVVSLTLNGVTQQYRVTEVDYAFSRNATLVRTDQGLYFSNPNPASTQSLNSAATALPSILDFVEVPITADDQTTYGPWFRIFSDPWQANYIYESPTTANYILDVLAAAPASIGTVNTAVTTPGPEDTWDMGTVLNVTMASSNDTLESLDDLSVLAGGNAALVKCNNGGWEVIQWATATLTSGTTYNLTRLLRARLGTEVEMNSGIPAGAEFVILNTMEQSQIGLGFFNVTLNYKWGPSSRAISDPTYQVTTYAPKMIGLRPYSPVHLATASGPSANDITLSWVRRDRAPEASDNWDLVEIPLTEASESYDVDIYNGSTVVRTFAALSSPTVVYTAAEQTTDFGSAQTSLKFAVYQNSATYGRGQGRTVTLNVPGNS